MLKASPCHNSAAGRIAAAANLSPRTAILQDLSRYTKEDLTARGGTRVEANPRHATAHTEAMTDDANQPQTQDPNFSGGTAAEAEDPRMEAEAVDAAPNASLERARRLGEATTEAADQGRSTRKRLNEKTHVSDGPRADSPASGRPPTSGGYDTQAPRVVGQRKSYGKATARSLGQRRGTAARARRLSETSRSGGQLHR